MTRTGKISANPLAAVAMTFYGGHLKDFTSMLVAGFVDFVIFGYIRVSWYIFGSELLPGGGRESFLLVQIFL